MLKLSLRISLACLKVMRNFHTRLVQTYMSYWYSAPLLSFKSQFCDVISFYHWMKYCDNICTENWIPKFYGKSNIREFCFVFVFPLHISIKINKCAIGESLTECMMCSLYLAIQIVITCLKIFKSALLNFTSHWLKLN